MLTAKTSRPALIATACALSVLSTGCSSISDLVAGDKADYRTAGKKSVALDIPPDLSQLTGQGRFTQAGTGPVSASAYAQQQAQSQGAQGGNVSVANNRVGNVSLERDGQVRWVLVANQTPEQVWPQVREFWTELGFDLPVDQANTGLLETNWKENRAQLNQGGLRELVGKVFENLYDTGERDLFRTRVERTAKGTEIYISHRGLIEVYTDSKKESTTWKARPSNANLEAEMMTRLMAKLGTPKDSAKPATAAQPVASAAPAAPRARLVDGGLAVAFNADYDQAWRRVGLALDRGGFTVEDRDRSKGFYEVRLAASTESEKPGLFDRMQGWFSSKPATDNITRHRLQVSAINGDAKVTVLNGEGKAVNTATALEVARLLSSNLE
jgi:outer membrane protein assembly factor BamC